MRRRNCLVLLLSLSCCAGPRPPLPPGTAVVVPGDWRLVSAPSRAIDQVWWRQLGDTALDGLVDEALASNVDLMAAGARISEARAQFRFASSRARPSLALSVGGGPGRDVNAFGEGLDQTKASGQLSVAYEVDLFGRLSAATEATRQTLVATEFARDATRVALVSTVVMGYIGLRSLDAQLQIASDTAGSRAAELTVMRRRADAGYSSKLDLRQAEAAYEAAARLIPASRLAISRQESALSVLAGRAPGPIARDRNLDDLGVIEVPHSLPAEVLRQRPDIAEAEARIASTDRDLDSARASFLPRVQLSAAGGGVASTVLSGPISIFSIGGSILAPLFQGGALRATADAAAARRDQAAYSYRRVVLTAFQEVEDALAGVENLHEEGDAVARQVAFGRAGLELARRRYRAGYASYLDQLDLERSLLDAQLQLVDLRRSQLATVVSLYRSLGGGWHRTVSSPREAPTLVR